MKPNLTRQFLALLTASARELSRDRLAMFFSFVFPLIFVGSFALRGGGGKLPALEVVDKDGSARAQALLHALERVADVQLIRDDAPRSVGARIVIPAGAFADGVADKPALVVSAPAATTPLLVDLLSGVAGEMTLQAHQLQPAFTVSVRTSEQRGDQVAFTIPGLLALALMELGLIATATPLLTARQRGSLQHLLLSPVNRALAVLAHMSTRLVIALLQVAMMSLLAARLFALHPAASTWLVIAVVALETAMLIALGYLAGALLPASDASYGILMVGNLALIFLGAVFGDPRRDGLFPVALVSPLFYAADANRQLFAGLPGVLSLTADAAAMGVWLVGCLLAAAVAVTARRER